MARNGKSPFPQAPNTPLKQPVPKPAPTGGSGARGPSKFKRTVR